MNLISPEEEQILRESHPHCADALVEWAERMRMNQALLENILLGYIQVSRFEDGELVLSLTENGVEYVETNLLPQIQ